MVLTSRSRRERARLFVLLSIALLLATSYGLWSSPAGARAAGAMTVTGDGTFEPFGPGMGMTSFTFDASDDGAGGVSGSFQLSGAATTSGDVVCVSVTGSTAIIGGSSFDPMLGGTVYVEIFVTDAGLSGDTIAIDGPTNVGPADCVGPGSNPEQPLTSGSIVIGTGGSAGSGAVVAVVGDGHVASMSSPSGQTFKFTAIDDGAGNISGDFSLSGSTLATGLVTCLRVDGSSIVIGGESSGGDPSSTLRVTIFATDGDLDGTADTIAFDGPTNMGTPGCDAESPPQSELSFGEVTILDGPSDVGTVLGAGTSDMGQGNVRTFSFDAEREPGGAVSGSFSVEEGTWFALTGGVIDCVDIRGTDAMLVGHGQRAGQFGQETWYATFFVTDAGPDGAGDTIGFTTYSQQPPSHCLAARATQDEPLLSGDIAIDASPDGGDPGPTPTPTGTLSMTSLNVQGGVLPGVTYSVTGTNGFAATVTDDGAGDADATPGLVRITPLDLDVTYIACVETIPADWYNRGVACGSHTLTATTPESGLAFDFEFVTPLTIDTSIAAPATVERYGQFEKDFTLSRFYHLEVHDPRRIEVTATFTAPSGTTVTVPAFWGRDYTVRADTESFEVYDPSSPARWHVRFSPDEIGTYTYTIKAQDKIPPSQATVVSAPLSFEATAATRRGLVEVDPRDPLLLRHEDGTPYYPVGHNVAFQQGEPVGKDGTAYVRPLFESMGRADQNWTRIWMTDFNRTALEWSTGHWSAWYTGVGQYADGAAFRIDEHLRLADDNGLQVQLVLADHGAFSTHTDARWADNPYNTARGGPVPAANPEQFFTNPEAKRLFKQRLRYLVARYGSYRNLLAWELFNEVQFTGSATVNPGNSATMRASIAAWHAEMAAYLRSIDPYGHLITSSSEPSQTLDDVWSDPNIDLVQIHDYGASTTRDARFQTEIAALQAQYGKPVIVGELGLPGQPECEFDPTDASRPQDLREHLLQGTHLHNAAWSSAMSRSGAMSWWWGCYVHSSPARNRTSPDFPVNERIFPPLVSFFDGEDLAALDVEGAAITAPASVVALGLDNGSRGFVWVRDAANEYGTGARPGDLAGRTMSGVSLELAGFADGTYVVDVFDPYAGGSWRPPFVAAAAGGTLTVDLPEFTRDIALKIRPGGPNPSAVVPEGGTLTTDTGAGATPDDPLVVSVTTPDGGPITISEGGGGTPPPTGYGLLGQTVAISAPPATAEEPLRLVFVVDAESIPDGDGPSTVRAVRNGEPVDDCLTGATGASPDPCQLPPHVLGDGDLEITVLTSAASDWSVVVPGPALGPVSGPSGPVAVGTSVDVSTTLTDAGSLAGHVVGIDWGDGTTSAGTLTGTSGTATVSGAHTYTAPGVHTVVVKVTDPSGQVASEEFHYVVVYDPSGPFATGGGTIVPGGASSDPNDLLPGLDGTSRANLGFVVKYKTGTSTVPAGSLTFHYNVGSFRLSADAFSWLVVTNTNWARFRGTATIAGAAGAYPFHVEARDGDAAGGSLVDRFSIRIWAPGADPDADEAIYKASGDVQGQVTIHRK